MASSRSSNKQNVTWSRPQTYSVTPISIFFEGSSSHDGWYLARPCSETGTSFEKPRSAGVCFGDWPAISKTTT